MSKKTAVEWLRDQITTEHEGRIFSRYEKIVNIRVFFNEALAMEREQKKQDIHNYFEWHKSKGYVSHQPIDIKQYYEETYGKEATDANG